jgi:calcium-dependent protein kinase
MITGSQFIIDNPNRAHDVYSLDERKIGEGSYGVVRRGTHKSTKIVRAIKVISKGQMKDVRKFRAEIEIMKSLDHPNIIKLFESFEDTRQIHLAMELCTGGELFDRIIEAKHFEEREAAVTVQQILRAVFYLHQQSICHRDLKPENFLFLTKDSLDKSVLKIIDFGLSCRFTPAQAMRTRAGTPFYVSPQVLSGKYDQSCDLWSVGVIMYILLCGYPPFYGRNDQEVLTKVRKGTYFFDEKDWGRVSNEAKNLIRTLLRVNPKERLTAEEALNHDWIQITAPRRTGVSLKANPRLLDNLRTFRTENKLKKAALQIIAGQLDESQIRGLRETWTALDENNDGSLTLGELKVGLEKAGLRRSTIDLEGIVEGMDTDGSGVVDYTEFIAAALDKRSYLSEQACWTAFKVFDLDGDGRISLTELRQVLERDAAGEVVAEHDAAKLLQTVDSDGNGMIDFEEFMDMMRGGRSSARSFGKDLMSMMSPRSARSSSKGQKSDGGDSSKHGAKQRSRPGGRRRRSQLRRCMRHRQRGPSMCTAFFV